jgi:hypothetical protein
LCLTGHYFLGNGMGSSVIDERSLKRLGR